MQSTNSSCSSQSNSSATDTISYFILSLETLFYKSFPRKYDDGDPLSKKHAGRSHIKMLLLLRVLSCNNATLVISILDSFFSSNEKFKEKYLSEANNPNITDSYVNHVYSLAEKPVA